MKDYYRAYAKMLQLIERETVDGAISITLQRGTVVTFNNRQYKRARCSTLFATVCQLRSPPKHLLLLHQS